jgi:hypothetical protein
MTHRTSSTTLGQRMTKLRPAQREALRALPKAWLHHVPNIYRELLELGYAYERPDKRKHVLALTHDGCRALAAEFKGCCGGNDEWPPEHCLDCPLTASRTYEHKGKTMKFKVTYECRVDLWPKAPVVRSRTIYIEAEDREDADTKAKDLVVFFRAAKKNYTFDSAVEQCLTDDQD